MAADIEFLEHIYHEGVYLLDEQPLRQAGPIGSDKANTPEEKNDVALEKSAVKYLGANEKGALFVVTDQGHDFINDRDQVFLMKIVESGLRFTKFDIAIANAARYPLERITDEIPYQFLIAFDLPEFRSQGKNYEVQRVDGKTRLFADSLQAIEAETDKKRMLWKALQEMFDIQKV